MKIPELSEELFIPFKTEPQIPGLPKTDETILEYPALEFKKLILSFFVKYPLLNLKDRKIYTNPCGTIITVCFDELPDGNGFGLYAQIESKKNPPVTLVYGFGISLWQSDGWDEWTVVAPASYTPFDLFVKKYFRFRSCDLKVEWNSRGNLVRAKLETWDREKPADPDWWMGPMSIEDSSPPGKIIRDFKFEQDEVVAITPLDFWAKAFCLHDPPHLLHEPTTLGLPCYNDFPETFRNLVPARIDLRWVLAKVKESLFLEGER